MSDYEWMRDNATIDAAWFGQIAQRLLNGAVLSIDGQDHRLLEIEFYYRGPRHDDAFTHGDDLQATFGRWYFHRDEGSYRGGSFKGLDLTFGPEGVYGGVLIRTIQKPDGSVVNGCSLCVDHMLATTGHARVSELDAALGERKVWEEGGPMQLVFRDDLDARDVIGTARVGLTLKRMYRYKQMPQFIMAPYRFLTDPTIKKGKVHTVIALHQRGLDVEQINALTRSPKRTISNYVAAYAAGSEETDFKRWRGKKLKTADLCRMHGVWSNVYGASSGGEE